MAARPRFTSRATVLVLVLCSLVAILAYPTRQFISQRAEISAQRAKADHVRQQVDQLRRDKARWQDPEYVKAQARARLHYAVPGETPYIAVNPAGPVVQPSAPAAPASSGGTAQAAAKPWYASVWDSVDAADTVALAPATPRPLPPPPVGDPTPHDH
ncbi:septum formation initiator family protein [Kitasatospora sp. NPDC101155]|uniref:FtsB family cell division protein n=1 Tax=Kitasatospora sp. NPDC101155 TaxID=3364097 RepID=UPI0038230DFA